jgi:chromate transport protein ChrA
MAFGQVPAVAGILYGIKPAVTAIVVFAAYRIGSRALKNEVLWSLTTHGDLKFTAPLTAITAAVVGVILNLAVFFAYHVLWPQGLGATFDWFSALLGLAASVALFRYNVGIIPVTACGAIGLMYSL